jgi:hypothetical protein
VKKEVANVSSMEAFPMVGLALQVEVPTISAMSSFPGPMVTE